MSLITLTLHYIIMPTHIYENEQTNYKIRRKKKFCK